MASEVTLSLEDQLRWLKGQVELLERLVELEGQETRANVGRRLTREEYRRHLEATRNRADDGLEPTELIRQMRTKEYG